MTCWCAMARSRRSSGPGLASLHDATLVDVSGCWIVPGLIDPHVHLRDPAFPKKKRFDRPASRRGRRFHDCRRDGEHVAGQRQSRDDALHARARARSPFGAAGAGFRSHARASRNRAGDFAAMVEAGARLFSDDGIPIDDAMVLSRALDETKRLGYAVALHEEDRALSCNGALNAGAVSKHLGVSGYPDSAESQRVRRDLALAIGSGAAVHVCHVSTRRVARTHPRCTPAWRASHLRSDAASFHPGRKRGDDLGDRTRR